MGRTGKILSGITLPTEPVRLTAMGTLTNLPRFFESHLNSSSPNNGNMTFIATLNRIIKAKNIIFNLNIY
jgi:hypothetical protein